MAMQIFNAGTTDLNALIMFVVDATKPFSVPSKLTLRLQLQTAHRYCA